MARYSTQQSRLGIIGFLISLTAAVVCCALYMYAPDFLDSIEMEFYDLRLRVRGERDTGTAVAVVAVDEKSIAELGRFPWSRSYMAGVVDRLSADGAKVIAFDITFSEPEKGLSGEEAARFGNLAPDDDRFRDFIEGSISGDYEFASSMTRAGNVLLPFVFQVPKGSVGGEAVPPPVYVEDSAIMIERGDPSGLSYITAVESMSPTGELGTRASGLGHIYAYIERDGVLRRDALVVEYDGLYYPSLGLAAAVKYLDIPDDKLVLNHGLGVEAGDVLVPTDEHGRLLINYYGPEGAFGYHSFADVYRGGFSPGTFRDKVVLVGATALGIYDLRVTPFSANMPGVEKHAAVITNILDRDFLLWREGFKIYDIGIILLIGVLLGIVLPRMGGSYGALAAFLAVAAVWAGCFLALDRYGIWLNMVYPGLTVGLSYVTVASYAFITEEMKSRSIKKVFASYVAPKVVDALVKNPELARLGGERKELTVLFSDVRGFTTFSENREPEEVVSRLNEYMAEMTDIIFRWDGTVDKFVGDEIMAFWGAPLPQKDHAERAVLCAVDMVRRLFELQEKWRAGGMDILDMGVGINTGDMVVGNMGAEGKKMDYTLIGDNVNLGARIEAMTREYDTHIIITEFTYNKIIGDMKTGDAGPASALNFKELGSVRVKGKERQVSIFKVEA